MKEKDIERKCCRYAVSRGWLSHKMGVGVSVGWPDRMFVGFGAEVLFIEFKQPGGKVRPAQERSIKRFAHRGFAVYVIDSFDEFERIMSLYKGIGELE